MKSSQKNLQNNELSIRLLVRYCLYCVFSLCLFYTIWEQMNWNFKKIRIKKKFRGYKINDQVHLCKLLLLEVTIPFLLFHTKKHFLKRKREIVRFFSIWTINMYVFYCKQVGNVIEFLQAYIHVWIVFQSFQFFMKFIF